MLPGCLICSVPFFTCSRQSIASEAAKFFWCSGNVTVTAFRAMACRYDSSLRACDALCADGEMSYRWGTDSAEGGVERSFF